MSRPLQILRLKAVIDAQQREIARGEYEIMRLKQKIHHLRSDLNNYQKNRGGLLDRVIAERNELEHLLQTTQLALQYQRKKAR